MAAFRIGPLAFRSQAARASTSGKRGAPLSTKATLAVSGARASLRSCVARGGPHAPRELVSGRRRCCGDAYRLVIVEESEDAREIRRSRRLGRDSRSGRNVLSGPGSSNATCSPGATPCGLFGRAMLFDLMERLADHYGPENVRLVAWLDS